MHHKQPQLPAQLSVIPLLCLLYHSEIGFQLLLFGKCRGIQTGQHLIMLISPPVCACNTGQLICLSHIFCTHQVRPCTQIRKFSLLIKADFLPFRQIFNQLHLIRLLLLFHQGNGFLPRQAEPLYRQSFLDDLLHLCLNLFQILCCNRLCKINIIIKTVCNRRTNGQLCLRIQPLYRLSHHMACRVAQRCQPLLIPGRQNIQATILLKNCP